MDTVGNVLRNEREKKGLSIKDIENATSIRALYINAIEENDFKVIPGEVYVKGFIRNYAGYLGLDPQKIMDIYKQMQQNTQPPVSEQPLPPAQNGTVAAVPKETKPNRTEKHTEKRMDKTSSTGKWMAAGVLAVCLAGGAAWMFMGPNQTSPSPVREQAPNKTLQQPSLPAVPSSPAPAAPAPQNQATVAAQAVTVTAKFTEPCWTLVTADGKVIYEGTPKLGESLTWEAKDSLTVKAGNAGGVEITYNGQPQGKLGGNGEVMLKTFSAAATNP
jgi:cytoskeletal protein RodZ